MTFFELTPSGRILNRFSQDVDDVDSTLPFSVNLFLTLSLRVVGIVILACIAAPTFTLAVPFIAASFVSISERFRRSSREVRARVAVARSLPTPSFRCSDCWRSTGRRCSRSWRRRTQGSFPFEPTGFPMRSLSMVTLAEAPHRAVALGMRPIRSTV
jgi:ABC-type multidrug transport system fused ATPase/permease subunit